MTGTTSTRRPQLVAVIVAVGLWAPTVTELARAWQNDTYAGHGLFVPLFSALIAWMRRGRLKAAVGAGDPAGFAVLLAGAAMLGLGVWQDSLLLKGASIAIAVAGLVQWSFGTACLRAAAFPVGFLLLMVPLPHAVVAAVTLRVQLFAATFAVSVLAHLDLPVHQNGVLIELPATTLKVGEVCNGLRFLMALLVLTAAFAEVTLQSFTRKIILVAAAIPIAIVANATRVATILLAVQWVGPEAAQGTIHNWIGKGVWAGTLIPLVGLAYLLMRTRVSKPARLEEGVA